ncbi:MAG: gluconate 2-dehydrogenase subunit 3 family protein [Chitinophagales bacterium]
MNRRQLIQSMAAVSGHALFPSVLSSFLTGCTNQDMSGYKPVFFSQGEYATIPEIIDIIIPATTTKSASQVNTQVFLDQVFAQCMSKEEQTLIRAGLQQMLPAFRDAKDKLQYIKDLDQKAYAGDAGAAFFKFIKQYTMIGFFTSQEGETKASNYVKIPGDYQGEVELDDHTLNYGKTFLHY